MSRLIKFRAKDLDGNWVFGTYSIGLTVGGGIVHEISTLERDKLTRSLVDPTTVGQYTGFKDCNKKEIYEDDLVIQKDGYIATIWFDNGQSGSWVLCHGNNIVAHFDDPMHKKPLKGSDLEIIGNSHEGRKK